LISHVPTFEKLCAQEIELLVTEDELTKELTVGFQQVDILKLPFFA
jgi:uncharacterized protein Smg (DUF494 family)